MKLKRILLLLTAVSTLFCMTACGDRGNTSSSAESMGVISDQSNDRVPSQDVSDVVSNDTSHGIGDDLSDMISDAGQGVSDAVSDVEQGASDLLSDMEDGMQNNRNGAK